MTTVGVGGGGGGKGSRPSFLPQIPEGPPVQYFVYHSDLIL